jgi:hypothetical protein
VLLHEITSVWSLTEHELSEEEALLLPLIALGWGAAFEVLAVDVTARVCYERMLVISQGSPLTRVRRALLAVTCSRLARGGGSTSRRPRGRLRRRSS